MVNIIRAILKMLVFFFFQENRTIKVIYSFQLAISIHGSIKVLCRIFVI